MYLLFAFAAVVAVITVAMYGSHVDATEYSQMIEGMYLDENRVIHLPQAAKACLEDLYLHEQDFDSKLLHLKRCEELDFDSVETKVWQSMCSLFDVCCSLFDVSIR